MMNLRLLPTFFYIGCIGFGGWASILAVLEKEFVTKRKMLTEDDIAEIMTYAKLLPGSTAVQIVSLLSWRIGGTLFSALATIVFILPAFFIMLGLAILYKQVSSLTYIKYALQGINAGVVGLLIVTTYKLGKLSITSYIGLFIVLASFLLVTFLHVPILIVVIAAGIWGLWNRTGQKKSRNVERNSNR